MKLMVLPKYITTPSFWHFPLVFSAFFLFTGCNDKEKEPPQNLPSTIPQPVFERVPSSFSGIKFQNSLPENDEMNILAYEYYYNGGGVAIGDVNGDQLPDIFFTANIVSNRLYLNRGNLQFEEVTKAAGIVSRPGWKTGVAMADVNGDGALDIYICRSGNLDEAGRANELFINNGNGTFTEKAAEYGLADPGYSTQASFFDYDRDGDLDMYLLNHAVKPDFNLTVAAVKSQRHPFFGDKLFRNDGNKFTDVSAAAGIKGNPIGFGLSVTIGDLNLDGWPDIFVANDYTEQDYLYINNGNATFTEKLSSAFAHTSHFSMGSDMGDINNDGLPDLMVLDMLPEDNYGQKILKGPDNYDRYQEQVSQGFYHQQMRNTLQVNLGNGHFSEIGQLAGLSNTDWSWSALMADFDNDGDKDIHITNGYYRASTHLDFVKYIYPEALTRAQQAGVALSDGTISQEMPQIYVSNYVFSNEGNFQFANRTREWGIEKPSFSNGAAYGDLDRDGDLDLVVNNIGEDAFIYRNLTRDRKEGHFLRIQFEGSEKNRRGTGAVVSLKTGEQIQSQQLIPVRGYQSSVEPVLHFGIPTTASSSELTVTWPDGKTQFLSEVPSDTLITLFYRDAVTPTTTKLSPDAGSFFSETTVPGLSFRHLEDSYVDFKREPLLPHMFSRMGPCLATGDVNQDGREDIFVGGAAGQAGKIFIQNPNGTFSSKELPGSEYEDTDACFLDIEGDGDADLYVGSGGSSFPEGDPRYQDRLYMNDGRGSFSLNKEAIPSFTVSTGCVRTADFDGDGDSDVFVGGRVIPGRYPYSPESFLLKNEGGKLRNVTTDFAPELSHTGMIADAAWADLNGDQKPDLILAGEWTPISIFINIGTRLENKTADYGLNQSNGWWNRLVVEDLDGDGDSDIIAGNRGLNAQMKASIPQPASVVVKDFDGNGTVDPILCSYIQGKNYPVATRDELISQLPFLKGKFLRYETYARATLSDVFAPTELAGALELKAYTFSTSWFENTGEGKFVSHDLPVEAQFSPVFGLLFQDFNGDGKKDILAAGNFHPVRAESGRMDAGYGQLFRGDGKGNFETVPLAKSGFFAPGDIRSMKTVRVSGGKQIFVMGTNDGNLKIFEASHFTNPM
ncbi:MAG: VCBS repeat-containing protein [Bacteroidia bacterium]|nr:VCBS repeat-containing protein [Bacteroidia bacterium]